MNRKEKAALLHEKGANCAQAVACAYCDKVGVAEDVAFASMEGFGFGMGNALATCGALSGAIYIASLSNSCKNPDNPTTKASTYAIAGSLTDKFLKKCGTLVCGEIKQNGLVSCAECINTGCDFLAELLGE